MSANGNIGLAIIGGSMAAGPAVVEVPFYESEIWLSCVAIIGFVVLLMTGVRAFLDIVNGLKKRRDKNEG